MPTTIYDAQDHDIWPDPVDRPPPAMREAIRQVAQDEITLEDIQDSGLTFAPWFSKFWLAEQRVRARMEAAKATLPTPPSAPAADPEELQQLRRRLAKLERMVLGKDAILLKAVGMALGELRQEIEDREPVPLARPLTDPIVHYCGLWNSTRLYSPGAMVTCNGAAWIAMSAMGVGVKPGDGETAWRLAVKSDTASLRALVKDEVRKQLGARAPASRTVTVR